MSCAKLTVLPVIVKSSAIVTSAPLKVIAVVPPLLLMLLPLTFKSPPTFTSLRINVVPVVSPKFNVVALSNAVTVVGLFSNKNVLWSVYNVPEPTKPILPSKLVSAKPPVVEAIVLLVATPTVMLPKSPPVAVTSPVNVPVPPTTKLLLMVVVPVVSPMLIVVASKKALMVVG